MFWHYLPGLSSLPVVPFFAIKAILLYQLSDSFISPNEAPLTLHGILPITDNPTECFVQRIVQDFFPKLIFRATLLHPRTFEGHGAWLFPTL